MVVRTHQLLALTSPVSIDTRPPNVLSWNRSRLRRPHVSLRCIVPPANRRTSKCGPIRGSGRGDGDNDSPASMADFFEKGAKMTSAAAKIWRCSVLPGDTVVDATCGEVRSCTLHPHAAMLQMWRRRYRSDTGDASHHALPCRSRS